MSDDVDDVSDDDADADADVDDDAFAAVGRSTRDSRCAQSDRPRHWPKS
jgi:hypothetical protein